MKHLDFVEKIEFPQDLDESLNCMEYSTFEQIGLDFSDFFQKNEKKMIGEFLLKNVDRFSISYVSRFYKGMISDELRTKYKRRTSLIKMISRF